MNILIIDDDDTLLSQLQLALNKHYNTTAINNLTGAFEELNKVKFDLVLLDYNLGLNNGLALMNNINNMDFPPKVIMMTSFATKDLVINALNKGVDQFIEKPFSIKEMREAIDKYKDQSIININGMSINTTQSTALINHQEIKLTQTELDLFLVFYHSPNKLIPTEIIKEKLWKGDQKAKNNLGTHLTNLKAKLPPLSQKLKNIRGKGYFFEHS